MAQPVAWGLSLPEMESVDISCHWSYTSKNPPPLGVGSVKDRYAIMLPEIEIPEYRSLCNVRAITALDGEEFSQTILLGMNVLNHGTTIIRRESDVGTFDFYESPTSNVKGSTRHRFNHLLVDGNYLISDAGTDELCNEAIKMFTENTKNGSGCRC